jgi:hypothetical protein
MKVFHLTENMRVKAAGSREAEAYSKWLLDVGNGTCGDGQLTIPEAMMTEQETLESLTNSVFPDLMRRYSDTAWMAERAIMSPTNKEVDEVNNYIIQKIPGEETVFKSIDSTEEESPDYTPEFLNTIEISGLPPHLLKIKKGAMVILLRNMDAKNGHCNGTKYVVQNIRPHVLELRAINGTNSGAFLLLPRIISITKTATLPFTLRRKQFPLKLAFALSANKVFSHTFHTSHTFFLLRHKARLSRQLGFTWRRNFLPMARQDLTHPLATKYLHRFMWHLVELATRPTSRWVTINRPL